METINTDLLVVGGGTGGTAAAIQGARSGVKTVLVSDEYWLGGMLTSAGVSVPDGNELASFHTGLWGAYLKALHYRQKDFLRHSWVSLFAYHPRTGANIFADWVNQLPNLQWIAGQKPQAVIRENNRAIAVQFEDYLIFAKIIVEATELGDLMALGAVPYRWGWEFQAQWQEPSAPKAENELTKKYPIQAPTWVVLLQDYGEGQKAAPINPPPNYQPQRYEGAWANYDPQKFLNYGRLPENLFMLNWPHHGNDYGEHLDRLIATQGDRQAFLEEAFDHSQGFAYFIQQQLGRRYGLAKNTFPSDRGQGAFALYPYYRESRRLVGNTTILEQDLLPVTGGKRGKLPFNNQGVMSAIAFGNYPNDHHYPGFDFPLAPKALRWGGRWTGTPFFVPYESLIPETVDGLLVCEKNISVSHIANGATRLQPVVMNIGQAVGVAAALAIELNCQPRAVPVRKIQEKLLTDREAPASIFPFFDLLQDHSHWLEIQLFFLDQPPSYPLNAYFADSKAEQVMEKSQLVGTKNYQSREKKLHYLREKTPNFYEGIFYAPKPEEYYLEISYPPSAQGQKVQLITILPQIHGQFQAISHQQKVSLWGNFNQDGNWILVEKLTQILED